MSEHRNAQGSLAEHLNVNSTTIHRWCLDGLLPDQPRRMGSGRHRSFTERDYTVARALVVASRALDAWEVGPIRGRIGAAIRDAAIAGYTIASVELAPGFTVIVEWEGEPADD